MTGTAAAVGGPPVALLFQHHGGPTVRATLGAFFAISATLSVIGYARDRRDHRGPRCSSRSPCIPAMLARRLWPSKHFHGLVDKRWLRPTRPRAVRRSPAPSRSCAAVVRCERRGPEPGPRRVAPRLVTVSRASTARRRLGHAVGDVSTRRPRVVDRRRSMPTSLRTFSLISTIMSRFSARNCLAFSRPWPSCSPS